VALRILIADDHELFRESLLSLLRTKPEVAAAAAVGSLADLALRVVEFRADVLLLDLQMERPAIGEITALAALTRVVIVTASEQLDQILAAVQAGARGVVSKSAAADTLIRAMEVVARGEVWLSPALQSRLVGALVNPSPDRLTPREREIVRLVAFGLRNAEVAAELYISPVTVKTHLGRVFEKLGVRDRADLVLYAVRTGLIGVDEKKL
jgi:DNA-binding NarL/FixJ family response regulator